MKLTVLGSGNMLPTRSRYPSAYVLEVNNALFLLDCGHCALARMTEMGFDSQVFARFVGDMQENKDFAEIKIIGPKGAASNWQEWRKIFWPNGTGKYPLQIDEQERGGKIAGLEYSVFPVSHSPKLKSIGFRLASRDKSIVYTGDVGQDQDLDELAENAKNADLLIIDAYGREQNPSHLTLLDVQKVVGKARPNRTLLTHLLSYPEDESRVRAFTNSKNSFIIARDKMVIDI